MAKRTTIPWLRRWQKACRMVLLPLAVLALPVRAGETTPAPAPSQPASTASLDYLETDFPINSTGLSITKQSAAFKKEPPAVSSKSIRGILNFGSPSNAVAFLWQRDAGKLFLDLNRNQDLTDDPAGISSRNTDESVDYQTFPNVHLVFITPSGRYPVLADLFFYDFGSSLGCNATLRSCWQGKLTSSGKDWQVGIIPNLSQPADACEGASLLLRAWDQRNEPFSAMDHSLTAIPFAQKLFAGGHAYNLHWLPGSHGGQLKPALQFVEQSAPLGDLKITGRFIRRIMLPGDTYLVICDQPGPMVKIPVGNYSPPSLLLEQSGVRAYCRPSPWQSASKFAVTDKMPAILTAGGPLTNSVSATRHGQNLSLDYQLLGTGGQTYQLASVDRSHPPQFAIYKGPRQIASGTFEFG